MNFVLTRTEQILGDSAVPPPPQPVSSSLGANASGRPVWQAARIRRSDMVIDEGESDGNTDSTYQNEEECTQEYKSRADFIGNVVDDSATVGMDDADANIIQGPVDTVQSVYAPVKMVVIDGIVMGHTVSIIVSKWIDLHIFISIVHMRTAFLTWLMHVVVFIVDIMRISMEENVMLPIAQVIRKLEHRPV